MEAKNIIYVPQGEPIELADTDGLHKSFPEFAEPYNIKVIRVPAETTGDVTNLINGCHAFAVRSNTELRDPEMAKKPRVIDPTKLEGVGIGFRAGEGVTNLDFNAAAKEGILLTNTPGENGGAVIQLVTNAAGSLLRGTHQASDAMKEGDWKKKGYMDAEPRTMAGLNVVVIGGCGKIGSAVATHSRIEGANVTIADEYGAKQGNSFKITNPFAVHKPNIPVGEISTLVGEDDAILPIVDAEEGLDKALAEADVVFVHISGENEDILNKERIKILEESGKKPIIIDASRAGNTRTDLVLEGIKQGKIGGAAIDVWDHEESEYAGSFTAEMIQEFENDGRLIATPHIGASTLQAQQNVAKRIAIATGELYRNGKLNIPGGPVIQGDIPEGRTRAIITHQNKVGADNQFTEALGNNELDQVRADGVQKGGKYGDGERYDIQVFDIEGTPEEVMNALKSTPLLQAIIIESPINASEV